MKHYPGMIRRLLVVAGAGILLAACASNGPDETERGPSALGANVPVRVLHNRVLFRGGRPDSVLTRLVRANLDLRGVREARVEEIGADGGSHLVVQLLLEGRHELRVTRLDVDGADEVTHITPSYQRTDEDQLQTTGKAYHCPDPQVELVALCPNDIAVEIQAVNDVVKAAEAAGLKTVRLLQSEATHDAWMNYMACPKLVGNFYDGDANSNEIITSDGAVTAREIEASVHFNLEVTNIWLACQAYNDPMLTAVQTTASAQKYAAGRNDLLVGPSDRAAVCTMKAAIAGKPMSAAFLSCYAQYDDPADQWGFGGDGSDLFGRRP